MRGFNFFSQNHYFFLYYFFSILSQFLEIHDIINILPLIEGVMVDYHTQKTNIIRDEVEGDIVVF